MESTAPVTEFGRHVTFHVGIVKALLLTLVRNQGHERTLRGWRGTTDDAIETILADPREVFVLDEACDNRNPDGSCAGHPLRGRFAK